MSEYLYDTLFDDLIEDTTEETTNYNTYNTQEDNKMKKFSQDLIEDFAYDNTLEEALASVHDYTMERIDEFVDGMYTGDLVELLQDLNPDLHTMEELDDVFDYMTPTQVLEKLSNICLYHDYFDADTRCSGDDLWDFAGISKSDFSEKLYDREIELYDNGELNEIITDEDILKQQVRDHYKIYDTARELFEKALARNPQEVINVLWNMNQQ